MIDLLETLRIDIKAQRGSLSDAQILAVLSTLIEDHVSTAFHSLSQPNK